MILWPPQPPFWMAPGISLRNWPSIGTVQQCCSRFPHSYTIQSITIEFYFIINSSSDTLDILWRMKEKSYPLASFYHAALNEDNFYCNPNFTTIANCKIYNIQFALIFKVKVKFLTISNITHIRQLNHSEPFCRVILCTKLGREALYFNFYK